VPHLYRLGRAGVRLIRLGMEIPLPLSYASYTSRLPIKPGRPDRTNAVLRPLELGTAEVRVLELGADKGRVLELGADEGRMLELGLDKACVVELGTTELRALELGAAEARVLELGTAEVRALELGTAEVHVFGLGLGADEQRALELGVGEVGSTEVCTPQVEQWVILHCGPPPKHRHGGLHIWRTVAQVGDLCGLHGLHIARSVLPDVGSEYLEDLKAAGLGLFGDALQSVDAA
jgi:hypothetical protein